MLKPISLLLVLLLVGQRQFEVKFSIDDKSFSVTVGSDTSDGARKLVQSQYPKAVIKSVTEVKGG